MSADDCTPQSNNGDEGMGPRPQGRFRAGKGVSREAIANRILKELLTGYLRRERKPYVPQLRERDMLQQPFLVPGVSGVGKTVHRNAMLTPDFMVFLLNGHVVQGTAKQSRRSK